MNSQPVEAEMSLSVEVRNRQGLVYSDQAKTVSSVNDVGDFDVLPRHANFICLIKKKVIVQRLKGGKETFPIDRGVLMVSQNKVTIFIGLG